MKIDTTLHSIPSLPGGDNRPAKTDGKAAGSTDSGVIVTESAAQMQALKSDNPVVNRARVEEIKQAITEGRININPANIADGLLASVEQMLGKGR